MIDRFTADNVGKLPFDPSGELVLYAAYEQMEKQLKVESYQLRNELTALRLDKGINVCKEALKHLEYVRRLEQNVKALRHACWEITSPNIDADAIRRIASKAEKATAAGVKHDTS